MNIIKLNATDSTNTFLKRLVQETAVEDQTVVCAETQTQGRGQRGNQWLSTSGQSLTFSVFKRFSGLKVEKQFMISMAASLAIVEALSAFGVPEISIKWPNDILSANKKIAGILIENVLDGYHIKHAIIGVGVNVNNTEFAHLPQASSLSIVLGRFLELDEVLKSISTQIFRQLGGLETLDFSKIDIRYTENLFRKDRISVFERVNGVRFNGIIMGISQLGELLVQLENSTVEKFQLQELKLLY